MGTHDDEGWPDWEINSLRDRVAELEEELALLKSENWLAPLDEDSWKYNDLG